MTGRRACGWRQWATRTWALLVAACLLSALPDSARGDTANAIAGGVTTALVMGILCSALATTPAPPPDEVPYARRGWMLGASGTYAITTGAPSSVSVDDSFGMNGRGGYRCHRNMLAEFEVEWVDGFEASFTDAGGGFLGTADIQPLTLTTNARGYFWTGRYQPFLQVGAGAMLATADAKAVTAAASFDNSDFAMRFGGGIDVFATKNIVVNVGADYVLPFGNLDGLDYVSIGWGFEYRF